MREIISPAGPISGAVVLPGDKSISHRYAMIAAIAEGPSTIQNYSLGADCLSTLGAVEALGIRVERDDRTVTIHGAGLDGLRRPESQLDAGNSAVPDGLLACPSDPAKAITAPGSCRTAVPTVPAPLSPPVSASPAGGPQHLPEMSAPEPALTLTSSSSALNAGNAIQLTANSTLDVSGTPYAIEIFDVTTQSLVAACAHADQCVVSFSAKSGTHQFIAFVASPTTVLPTISVRLTSNKVDVSFLGVSLQVKDPAIVAPGSPVTFVANATQDVGVTGFAGPRTLPRRMPLHSSPCTNMGCIARQNNDVIAARDKPRDERSSDESTSAGNDDLHIAIVLQKESPAERSGADR